MTDEPVRDWPGTSVPNTAEWVRRCLAHLMSRDPRLDHAEASVLAADMSTELWCRSMVPEAAVDKAFRDRASSWAPLF